MLYCKGRKNNNNFDTTSEIMFWPLTPSPSKVLYDQLPMNEIAHDHARPSLMSSLRILYKFISAN